MKSSAYIPPFYTKQPPHFYKKILTLPPSMSFQKSQPPINRELHTINILYTEVFSGIFCPNCEAT